MMMEPLWRETRDKTINQKQLSKCENFFNYWSLSPIDFFKSKTEICVPVLSLHIAFLQALSNLGKTIIYSVFLADDFFVPVHWHSASASAAGRLGIYPYEEGKLIGERRRRRRRMSGWHGDPILLFLCRIWQHSFAHQKHILAGKRNTFYLI